jgi:protoheme IX farnesyltransferase
MDVRGSALLLLELTKIRITFFVTLSVATGYLLFTGAFEVAMLVPMAGVLLLSCGSAALNQVQEWRIDARMGRTKDRPIPSGRIRPDGALFLVIVLMGAGFYVLSLVEHHVYAVLALGAFSALWYNGVYSPLKRVTAFAVVPGALIGALPPLIGWVAAGGLWRDPSMLEVCGFFFLWQIPHFWLLSILYGREYEEAGMPSPSRHLNPDQFRRVTFVWILAVAASALSLTVSRRLGFPYNALVVVATVWLVLTSGPILRRHADGRRVALRTFLRLNLYALGVMVVLVCAAVL